jgi:hypothetical protein
MRMAVRLRVPLHLSLPMPLPCRRPPLLPCLSHTASLPPSSPSPGLTLPKPPDGPTVRPSTHSAARAQTHPCAHAASAVARTVHLCLPVPLVVAAGQRARAHAVPDVQARPVRRRAGEAGDASAPPLRGLLVPPPPHHQRRCLRVTFSARNTATIGKVEDSDIHARVEYSLRKSSFSHVCCPTHSRAGAAADAEDGPDGDASADCAR